MTVNAPAAWSFFGAGGSRCSASPRCRRLALAAGGPGDLGQLLCEPLEARQMLAADLSGTLAFGAALPASFRPGATIANALISVANNGDVSTDVSPSLRAVLSLNNVFGDGDDVLLENFPGEIIAAGATSDLPKSFVIPATAAAGSYYLLVGLDPDNQIDESDETNNVIATPAPSIVVAGAPVFADLQTSLGPVAGTFLPGQEVPVSFTTRNTGQAAADNFVTRIVLSRNAIFGDGDDISIQSVTEADLGGINPGESFTDPLSVFIPDVIDPGAYYIMVKIDVNDQVQESNEANNVYRSATASVVIAPPPVVSIVASVPSASETGPAGGRFTLTRTGPTALPLALNLIIGGTATSGDDYQPLSTFVTFLPGVASISFDVSAIDDMLIEPSETVIVSLEASNRYDLSPGRGTATVTIVDNEPTISVVATRNTASETAGPTSTALLTFTRTGGPLSGPLTVNYMLGGGGTAVSGVDFQALSGLVTFSAGSATATVTITAIDDALVEPTESLSVVITPGSSYRVSATQSSAAVSITDNEPTITIAATQAGVEGVTPALYTFTRSGGSNAGALTVNFQYNFAGTTAIAGPDFAQPAFSITFAAGSATAILSILPVADGVVEPTETLAFSLLSSTSYRLGGAASAVGSILDNEPTITITAPDNTASETAPNTGTFLIRRTGGLMDRALTVNYSTTGTTVVGSDITTSIPLSGNVQFAPGQSEITIIITPTDDVVSEPDEFVVLTLVSNVSYRIGQASSATVTIQDNEPIVSVIATGATGAEGGSTALRYTISRAGPTTSALGVAFTFAGTAASGSDFTPPASLMVTIPVGQSSVVVSVNVIDDAIVEPTETAILQISAASSYRVSSTQGSAVATITDNEATVSVAATDPAAGEAPLAGQPNRGRVTFTRTGPTSAPLTVNYTFLGTAVPGADYEQPSGTVTFLAGSATAVLDITPLQDLIGEGPETVIVRVGWGASYKLDPLRGAATITIADDEPVVTIAATAPSTSETAGAPGRFTVTRTGPTTSALTVNYLISGTATSADDYVALTGSVVIPAGALTATITVTPVDDQLVEPIETVIATLASGAAYSVSATPALAAATVAITDNEPVITIAAADPSSGEAGDPGRFLVTRTGPTNQALTVQYTIAGSAGNGVDYATLSGTVTIAAGALSAEIVVAPIQDSAGEGRETVTLALSAATSYRLPAAGASATVNIADDEPTVTLASVQALTAEGGATPGRVSVTRTGGSTAQPLTVHFTVSGTATRDVDYSIQTSVADQIVIPAGARSASFNIAAIQDALGEATETVVIMLTGFDGYVVTQAAPVTISITDDEPALTVTTPDAAAGESGANTGRFLITRTGNLAASFSATFNLEGAATEGDDFAQLASHTIMFAAGQATASITITPSQDAIGEGPETVVLRLTGNDGYRVVESPLTRTVTIADDEPVVTVSAADPRASEPGVGPADTARYTFVRTGPTTGPLTVAYALSGTASVDDYAVSSAGTITFAAGSATATLTLTALADALAEPDETVVVSVTGNDGYYAAGPTAQATAVIAANGPVVGVVATDPAAAETLAGAPANPGRFTLTRTGSTAAPLTVSYHMAGSADASDYAQPSGTVTFLAGQLTATVDLNVIDDLIGELAETAVLVLEAGDSYRVAPTQAQATVTIADNEPVVTVAATDPAASENGTDIGRYTFTRTGPLTSALTVTYVMAGTATNGVDYQNLPLSFTIPAGAANASLTLTALADLIVEGPETAQLTLTQADGYRVGAGASASVTIANVGQPDLAITDLTFAPASYSLGTPGQTLGLLVQYSNLGAALAGPFTIEIRLSADDIFGNADDFVLRVADVAGVGALADGQLMLSIALDGAVPPTPGAYHVAARIDAGRRVTESNENNNDFVSPDASVVVAL